MNFNILTADVTQNGSTLEPSITGGTPHILMSGQIKWMRYWQRIRFHLANRAFLFYVYDRNNCVSILYVSYDQTATIDDLSPLSIYPTPAKDYVKINNASFNSYQLINLKGQIVATDSLLTLRYGRNQLPRGYIFKTK